MSTPYKFLKLFENVSKTLEYLEREGFTAEEAAEAVEIGGKKYGAWVAVNVFGIKIAGDRDPSLPPDVAKERTRQVIEKIFEQRPRPALPAQPHEHDIVWWQDRLPEMQYINDWALGSREGRGGLPPQGVDLGNLSWEDALQGSREWHERIAANTEESKRWLKTKENQVVVHRFDDGWYWLDLRTPSDRDEANAMGHCGNGQYNLFSLREPLSPEQSGKVGRPWVTSDIDTDEKVAYQTSGPGNKTPDEDHWWRVAALWGLLEISRVLEETPHGGGLSFDTLTEEFKQGYEETYGIELESHTRHYAFDGTDLNEANELRNKFNTENSPHVFLDYTVEDDADYGDWSEDRMEFSVQTEWSGDLVQQFGGAAPFGEILRTFAEDDVVDWHYGSLQHISFNGLNTHSGYGSTLDDPKGYFFFMLDEAGASGNSAKSIMEEAIDVAGSFTGKSHLHRLWIRAFEEQKGTNYKIASWLQDHESGIFVQWDDEAKDFFVIVNPKEMHSASGIYGWEGKPEWERYKIPNEEKDTVLSDDETGIMPKGRNRIQNPGDGSSASTWPMKWVEEDWFKFYLGEPEQAAEVENIIQEIRDQE